MQIRRGNAEDLYASFSNGGLRERGQDHVEGELRQIPLRDNITQRIEVGFAVVFIIVVVRIVPLDILKIASSLLTRFHWNLFERKLIK